MSSRNDAMMLSLRTVHGTNFRSNYNTTLDSRSSLKVALAEIDESAPKAGLEGSAAGLVVSPERRLVEQEVAVGQLVEVVEVFVVCFLPKETVIVEADQGFVVILVPVVSAAAELVAWRSTEL